MNKAILNKWVKFTPNDKYKVETMIITQGALSELCHAFGWQGGTIHQVIDQIFTLKGGDIRG